MGPAPTCEHYALFFDLFGACFEMRDDVVCVWVSVRISGLCFAKSVRKYGGYLGGDRVIKERNLPIMMPAIRAKSAATA